MLKYLGMALCLFLISNSAFAYIDPGTGSMFIQATIAALAGIGVTVKMYWQRIKLFFYGSKNKITENSKKCNEYIEK